MCLCDTVSKAFARSKKATHNGFLFFLVCLIISSIRKPFSEHPAALIKPLCLSFILNVSSVLVARIFVYILSTTELIVRGLQLLMLSRPSVPLGSRIERFSFTSLGTLPVMSQVLKRFESAIPSRSSAISFLSSIRSGPAAVSLFALLKTFTTSSGVMGLMSAALSTGSAGGYIDKSTSCDMPLNAICH